MQNQSPKHKLSRILQITNWSHDRLADMLDISNGTLRRWLKGRTIKHPKYIAHIDWLYSDIVEPLECEILTRSNRAEKRLLQSRASRIPDPTSCH
ncbi:hypothetical protein FWG86_02065 [Candidatus Saccharibacteria bacterium]|nr:hypothetical protein [Candidatus Saccharibacteria bacterium]